MTHRHSPHEMTKGANTAAADQISQGSARGSTFDNIHGAADQSHEA